MKSTRASTIVLLSAALAAGPALAGVVYEIEVKDHEQSPPKTSSLEMAAEGKNLKMDILPGESGRGRGEMIFRGDRREVVVVDDDDRSYHVMDEATMQQIAGQVAGVMGQMQEALKNVPESERRKIEEMMKQRMPQQQAPSRPTIELRKIGERGTHNGYPCVKYEVYRGGAKIRELWVTDWDNIEGGSEVVGAFEEMADFFKELMDSDPRLRPGRRHWRPGVRAHAGDRRLPGGDPRVRRRRLTRGRVDPALGATADPGPGRVRAAGRLQAALDVRSVARGADRRRNGRRHGRGAA